eukprot:sb/3471510/
MTTKAAAPSIEEGINIETLELEEDETPMVPRSGFTIRVVPPDRTLSVLTLPCVLLTEIHSLSADEETDMPLIDETDSLVCKGGRHTEVGRARSHLNLARHTEVRSSKFRGKVRTFAKPHFRMRNHLKELLVHLSRCPVSVLSHFHLSNLKMISQPKMGFRETSNFSAKLQTSNFSVSREVEM